MITNSKEQTTGGYNDMDGSQEIRCSKKTDTKEYLLYGSIFMKLKNRDDSTVVAIILVADSGRGTCIPLSHR